MVASERRGRVTWFESDDSLFMGAPNRHNARKPATLRDRNTQTFTFIGPGREACAPAQGFAPGRTEVA
jgi:hypothetical protein